MWAGESSDYERGQCEAQCGAAAAREVEYPRDSAGLRPWGALMAALLAGVNAPRPAPRNASSPSIHDGVALKLTGKQRATAVRRRHANW